MPRTCISKGGLEAFLANHRVRGLVKQFCEVRCQCSDEASGHFNELRLQVLMEEAIPPSY
jgi:hypothetical protein